MGNPRPPAGLDVSEGGGFQGSLGSQAQQAPVRFGSGVEVEPDSNRERTTNIANEIGQIINVQGLAGLTAQQLQFAFDIFNPEKRAAQTRTGPVASFEALTQELRRRERGDLSQLTPGASQALGEGRQQITTLGRALPMVVGAAGAQPIQRRNLTQAQQQTAETTTRLGLIILTILQRLGIIPGGGQIGRAADTIILQFPSPGTTIQPNTTNPSIGGGAEVPQVFNTLTEGGGAGGFLNDLGGFINRIVNFEGVGPSFIAESQAAQQGGAAGCGAPFRNAACGTGVRAVPADYLLTNPVSQKAVWFGPKGRPLLWSGDVSAARRLQRVSKLAAKHCGGVRRRSGGR